jgi:CRP/FNR family transcriptional regulator, cyclic AMP receptor protein
MKYAEEVLEQLRRIPLFSSLSAADLESLLPAVRRRTFSRQSSIFREGDSGDALYVIVAGEVKISRTLERGDEILFALLEAGDAFGELAVLQEDAVRSADATAVSETECLVIRRDPVVDFLKAHPAAMWHVVGMLSDYIKRKDEGFVDLAVRDIPGRVAHKLLELTTSRGKQSKAAEDIKLSQATLAGLVGASRENVNRALSRFVSLGYIKLDRGRIVVLRPEELRRRSV